MTTKTEALHEMERLHALATLEARDFNDEESARFAELRLFINPPKETPMEPIIDAPAGALRTFAGQSHKTLSDAVIEDGAIARMRQSGKARTDMQVMLRALGSTQAASPAPGIAVQPDYKGLVSSYIPLFGRLVDAMASIPTTSNSITYTRIGYAQNNAAKVQELTAKPESVLSTDTVVQAVETFAHFVKSSKQVLDDESGLRALIDVTLSEGLKDKIDAIIFAELVSAGRFTTYTPTTGDTAGDAMARVAATLRILEGAGSVKVAVNPVTFLNATLLKASGTGAYLGLPPNLNASIVQSASVPAGQVLAWTDSGAAFLEREGVSVVVGLDSDDFTHNRVTILAEARGAALTLDARKVYYGALTAA